MQTWVGWHNKVLYTLWENVKWSSLLFAVSVPVHNDNGEMIED